MKHAKTPDNQPTSRLEDQSTGRLQGQPNDWSQRQSTGRLQRQQAGRHQGQPYGRHQGQQYDQPYGQPYGRHQGQPYGQQYNQPYGQRPVSDVQVLGNAAVQRKQSRGKRVAIIVGVVVLALLLAVGGYYLWFTLSLNNSLSKNADEQAVQALEDAPEGKPFYMLVLASDERIDEHDPNASMQTDVMMLVRVDLQNDQVTMLSIPRDTRYVLDDGTVVKINSLYNVGGVKKVIEGVSELTNLPISHYALVYMSDLKHVVDELGGVEVDVPIEINNDDPETDENVNIQPGEQVLNGQQAQAFAISRHEAEPGTNEDAYRQGKIRELFGAIIKSVLDRPPLEIPGLVINLAQYVETDMRANDLMNLAAGFANNRDGITLYEASGPSDGDIDESADGQWLCYENPEGWAEVVRVMDSGGDPSTVTYDQTS